MSYEAKAVIGWNFLIDYPLKLSSVRELGLSSSVTIIKGEFRAQDKLGPNQRASQIQKNEPSLTFMCQLVLEILQFKVIFPPHKDTAIFIILNLVPIKRKSSMTS